MRLEILSHLYFFLKQVYLYGGQVTSWKNDHGEELLFVSSKVPCLAGIVFLYLYAFRISNLEVLALDGSSYF